MKKNSACFVDEEDQKLFDYIFRFKVASTAQIKRDIYPSVSIDVAYKRLQKFCRYKYLHRKAHRVNKQFTNVFSLTPLGFKDFITEKNAKGKHLKSDTIDHDLKLIEIANRIQSGKRVNAYYTENALKCDFEVWDRQCLEAVKEVHPDAIARVHFPNGEYSVAIEYEARLKNPTRYEDLFYRYREKGGAVPGIFYICANSRILNKIQQWGSRIRPKELYKILLHNSKRP